MTKKENTATVSKTVSLVLEKIRAELESNLEYMLEGDLSKKDMIDILYRRTLIILEQYDVGVNEVDQNLIFSTESLGDTLIVNPGNLYTAIVMFGKYVSPEKLVGEAMYEFEDVSIGWTAQRGVCIRSKQVVEHIECKIKTTKTGIEW